MTAYSKELIIFDLDGTLTPSKMPMEKDVAEAFMRLIERKKVAIISGTSFHELEIRAINPLPSGQEGFSNLLLLPASGTQLYVWKGTWCEQYAEHLSPKEKENIMTSFNWALKAGGYVKPEVIYGDLFEDLGAEITFSGLGQKAPLELKSAWDPDHVKRELITVVLKDKLPGYEVRIGGTTSISVTRRGINKGYGIRKLEEYLKMPLDHMLFVGDALYPDGNDYPAKATGIDCVQVSGPEETKKLIESWLE